VPSSSRWPTAARNPLSLLGVLVATVSAVLFLAVASLELLGYLANPYIGLLSFVVIPTVFVLGLLLIPIGAWWTARRHRHGPAVEPEWPVFDLRDARRRTVFLSVIALTVVNMLIVSIAAYGGVHYMESSEFCGQVCHTTMEPQYAAHQVWPHARVPCVACHVGEGAGALVESKLAGTRQLVHVMTGRVPQPIPPAAAALRPARETCERCHWPEKFQGDKRKTIREYASDESNTESAMTLTLRVGGGSRTLGVGSGIHWHMNLDNQIEYIATGPDLATIPFVRFTDRAGHVREFVVEGTSPEQLAAGTRRRMDCMDCHNRSAHTFFASPERAVDAAIAQGRLSADLPFVRREAVAAVGGEYADRPAALAGIAQRLAEFYEERGVDTARIARAVLAAQDIWSRNVFPAMRVRFGTYPNQLGHVDAPGCFRCHDDGHKAADGSVIRQDCELCHGFE
jgi:hypothetical protein